MTDEQLLELLQCYDAECLYDPETDDQNGTQYFQIAGNSFRVRKTLRDYLYSKGVLN